MKYTTNAHASDVLALSRTDLQHLAKGLRLETAGIKVVLDSVVGEIKEALGLFVESGKKPDMLILPYAKKEALLAEYTEHLPDHYKENFMGARIYGYGGDRIVVSGE